MITSVVGKTFLDAYNKKYNKQLTPKEFFVEEYFELFFNHNKYMQWVTNSPFVQMKAGQKVNKLTSEERAVKLDDLHKKVLSGKPDASFALGYPASEAKEYASTSGLVSDINIDVTQDEIYLSWIGSGLGVGVAGGYTMLIDDAEITLLIYEGWKIYRKYLNDISLNKLRDKQIGTWNGQWLSYALSENFDENFDFGILTDEKFFKISSDEIEVKTVNWTKLYFGFSRLYPNSVLTAYVYSFGNTNKTIGFIPMYLTSGTKLKNLYKQLIGNDSSLDIKDFENLFGMHIISACVYGNIGLHSLRPEGLLKYMNESKNLSFKNNDDKINYYVFKTWLISMLNKNKEEVTEYTIEMASIFLKYKNSGNGNTRKTLVETLFDGKNKRLFIEKLTSIIRDIPSEYLQQIKSLKDEIHLMTNEEFVYFSTLLKFDYAFLEKQS